MKKGAVTSIGWIVFLNGFRSNCWMTFWDVHWLWGIGV